MYAYAIHYREPFTGAELEPMDFRQYVLLEEWELADFIDSLENQTGYTIYLNRAVDLWLDPIAKQFVDEIDRYVVIYMEAEVEH